MAGKFKCEACGTYYRLKKGEIAYKCKQCGYYEEPFSNQYDNCLSAGPPEPPPLPEKSEALNRKAIPLYTCFVKYFPRAMREVAKISKVGNDQHNPGSEPHWDRSKSKDEQDAMMRHITDVAQGEEVDSDGQLHRAKVAWRAMADLEKYLEKVEERNEI